MNSYTLHAGDALSILKSMPDESVQCVVTSPPYWGLRDYGMSKQLGLESTPKEYVVTMVDVFRQVKRVLKNDGTLWINLGDSYAHVIPPKPGASIAKSGLANSRENHEKRWAGMSKIKKDWGTLKPKDLVGIPWRLAFALQNDGWYLRSDIIWAKPNPMPESVVDRPTRAHEYIFLFSKSRKYYYDADAIREPRKPIRSGPSPTKFDGHTKNYRTDKQRGHGRRHAGFNDRWDAMPKEEQQSCGANKRSVWNVATRPFSEAHFATFPIEIPLTCIRAGTKHGDLVLDPFSGAGTTGVAACSLGREYVGIELNPEYNEMAEQRLIEACRQDTFPFT